MQIFYFEVDNFVANARVVEQTEYLGDMCPGVDIMLRYSTTITFIEQ